MLLLKQNLLMLLVLTCVGRSRNDVTKIIIFFDTIVTHLSKIFNTLFPLRPWRHLWTIPSLINWQIRHIGLISLTFYEQLLHSHRSQYIKIHSSHLCLFALLGSGRIKAASKPVDKLTLVYFFFIYISCWVCHFWIGSASDWSSERQTRCFNCTAHRHLVLKSRYILN